MNMNSPDTGVQRVESLSEIQFDFDTDHNVIGYCWAVFPDGSRLSCPIQAAWELQRLQRIVGRLEQCDDAILDPAVDVLPCIEKWYGPDTKSFVHRAIAAALKAAEEAETNETS